MQFTVILGAKMTGYSPVNMHAQLFVYSLSECKGKMKVEVLEGVSVNSKWAG